MREHLRNRNGFRTEVLNYAKSGKPYWVAIEVQPVRDASGKVTNFMAIEGDITERRQNEQRRQLQHAVSGRLPRRRRLSEGVARAIRAIPGSGMGLGCLLETAIRRGTTPVRGTLVRPGT